MTTTLDGKAGSSNESADLALAKELVKLVFEQSCISVNSEIAMSKDFRNTVRARLSDVRNDCAGDISRALEADPEVSEDTNAFAKSLANSILKR